MLILTIRTDKPEAEIALYEGTHRLSRESWQAHRELSQTIHTKIEELLKARHKGWNDVEAIVCFKGPGIGLTVGNTLAYSLSLPIVSASGKEWASEGISRIQNGEDEKVAVPEYGAEAHITTPRK
jgi:tRNA A37 threonylcarbamoyladenosine modification protein TsaB